MKRFLLRGGLFVLLPLVVLEVAVRVLTLGPLAGVDRLHDVYDAQAGQLARGDTINHVFVGTSRVASAIRPKAFAQEMNTHAQSAAEPATPAVAVRAARGFSTLAVHAEGIETLLRTRPEAMQGAVVYVEAPAGLVEPQTWSMRWTRSEWPELLSPYLTAGDTPRYWSVSGDPVSTKTRVTAAAPLYLVRFWSSIRRKVSEDVGKLFQQPQTKNTDVDLNDAAGIRTDSAGVALVRKKIVPEMRGWAHVEHDRPPIDWDESVFARLVERVQASGGSVVVYDMPISTPARAVIDSNAVLQRDRAALNDWLSQHGVTFVTANFEYSDDDFPDLSHLRNSRAAEFSRALARSASTRSIAAQSHP